jgi:hypothetical protein
MLLIIAFNTIRGISVGADLSRPPPIYRPSVAFTISPSFAKNHYRPSEGLHDIPPVLFNFMIITQRFPRTSESKRAPSFYPRESYAGTW